MTAPSGQTIQIEPTVFREYDIRGLVDSQLSELALKQIAQGFAVFLKEKGIDTGLHYPIPIHLQKAYSYLNYKEGDYPLVEKYANEILSLPIFPGMTNEEVDYVCDNIKEFYSK